MSYGFKKWLGKEILDGIFLNQLLKDRWDFKVQRGKRNYFKQNKLYEEKVIVYKEK